MPIRNLGDIVGVSALLGQLRTVETEAEADMLVEALARPDRALVVSFLNQHGLNLASGNPAFLEALKRSDILLRDGIGMELCLRLLDRRPGLNMNGTDLIPRLLAASRGRSIAVFGTAEPWLSNACARIEAEGGRVVSALDGFRDTGAYVAALKEHRPELVILAMGMPKQEILAVELARAADGDRLILNGGAIVDYLGDRFTRAPGWIRALQLEWLFRLVREPRRLAHRYVIGGYGFARRIMALKRLGSSAR